MTQPTPDSLHEAVHQALLAGDFDAARDFGGALGKAIIRQATGTPPSERAAYLQRGLNRLHEHLNLARVLRAHLASQVKANSAVCLYHQPSDHCNSWRFDA